MRRLSGSDGALRIMIATSGGADCRLIRCRFMALMHCLAKTAGMYRCGCDRERQWKKASNQREQQQKSCGQALHGFVIRLRTPRGEA
jgi:hypothetical protein